MTEVRGAKNMAEKRAGEKIGEEFPSFRSKKVLPWRQGQARKRVEGISRRHSRKITFRLTALYEAQLYVILSQILVKSAPYFFLGGGQGSFFPWARRSCQRQVWKK